MATKQSRRTGAILFLVLSLGCAASLHGDDSGADAATLQHFTNQIDRYSALSSPF
jgi:hypothetical protein